MENTFTSVEAMVSRVVPPLGLVVGPGKPLNFLVTNKWHNRDEVKKIRSTPVLMLVSLNVSVWMLVFFCVWARVRVCVCVSVCV